MASKVSIANQAIGWLGGNLITAFGDDSKEAALISANYDGVRDAVLEDCTWTFASKRVVLSPVLAPPSFGYSYEHVPPPDTLRIITVRNDARNSGPSNLDWVRESGRILCDCELIYVRYIFKNDDPSTYSANFVQCLAARLAADLAIPLSQSRSLQQDMFNLYMQKLNNAKTIDGMQGREQLTGKRKFHTVRGASGGGSAMGPVV